MLFVILDVSHLRSVPYQFFFFILVLNAVDGATIMLLTTGKTRATANRVSSIIIKHNIGNSISRVYISDCAVMGRIMQTK